MHVKVSLFPPFLYNILVNNHNLWIMVCFIMLYFPHVVWLLRKGGGHGEKKMKRWDLLYPIQPKSMEGFGSSIFFS